jgi:hypothetical protein
MKIRQTEIRKQGRSQFEYERVIEVDEAPEGAEIVDDETPAHDWRKVSE